MSQKIVVIEYKGFTREEPLRFDVLVEGCVLVEAKAVEKIVPIHKAQLLSYMKLLDVPLGLLINLRNESHRWHQPVDFSRSKLIKTPERSLPGANRENGENISVSSCSIPVAACSKQASTWPTAKA